MTRLKHLNVKPGDLVKFCFKFYIMLKIDRCGERCFFLALRLDDLYIEKILGSFPAEILKGLNSCQ